MSGTVEPTTDQVLTAIKAETPFSPLRCPQCNRLPIYELDSVLAQARLVNHGPDDEHPQLQWEGTTDIDWDSQCPVLDGEKHVTLGCGGHEWQARKTGEVP